MLYSLRYTKHPQRKNEFSAVPLNFKMKLYFIPLGIENTLISQMFDNKDTSASKIFNIFRRCRIRQIIIIKTLSFISDSKNETFFVLYFQVYIHFFILVFFITMRYGIDHSFAQAGQHITINIFTYIVLRF